jgi:hypothetical protein
LPRRLRWQELSALILGNDPLDLDEQLIFWRLPHGSIEKDHLHAGLPQLVQNHRLMRLLAGQPIRTMDIEAIQTSGCRHIPQPLQRWAHEAGSTVALIPKRPHLVPGDTIGRDTSLQIRELTGDCLGLGLVARQETRA